MALATIAPARMRHAPLLAVMVAHAVKAALKTADKIADRTEDKTETAEPMAPMSHVEPTAISAPNTLNAAATTPSRTPRHAPAPLWTPPAWLPKTAACAFPS